MSAIFYQLGGAIDYTPATAVAAGDVVVIGSLVGVAKLDIPANTTGALALTGVYKVSKGTGAITAGTVLYWNKSSKQVVTSGSDLPVFGIAVADAASGDATVLVRLNH